LIRVVLLRAELGFFVCYQVSIVVSFGAASHTPNTTHAIGSHPARPAPVRIISRSGSNIQVICALRVQRPCLSGCSSAIITSQGSTPTGIARYDPVTRPTNIVPWERGGQNKVIFRPPNDRLSVPPSPIIPGICTCTSALRHSTVLVLDAHSLAPSRGEKTKP